MNSTFMKMKYSLQNRQDRSTVGVLTVKHFVWRSTKHKYMRKLVFFVLWHVKWLFSPAFSATGHNQGNQLPCFEEDKPLREIDMEEDRGCFVGI